MSCLLLPDTHLATYPNFYPAQAPVSSAVDATLPAHAQIALLFESRFQYSKVNQRTVGKYTMKNLSLVQSEQGGTQMWRRLKRHICPKFSVYQLAHRHIGEQCSHLPLVRDTKNSDQRKLLHNSPQQCLEVNPIKSVTNPS